MQSNIGQIYLIFGLCFDFKQARSRFHVSQNNLGKGVLTTECSLTTNPEFHGYKNQRQNCEYLGNDLECCDEI